MKVRVGDKVLIKKYEDMVEEFGLDANGNINTKAYFVTDMKEFCNEICEVVRICCCDCDNYGYMLKGCNYCWFSDDMIKRKMDNMTKNDLKSGMIVETRNGKRYITIVKENKTFNFMNLDGCTYLADNNLLDDMTNINFDYDIIKIYKMKDTLDECKKTQNLIWERQEPREMTITEIEKKLGYSIKVVDNDERN